MKEKIKSIDLLDKIIEHQNRIINIIADLKLRISRLEHKVFELKANPSEEKGK